MTLHTESVPVKLRDNKTGEVYTAKKTAVVDSNGKVVVPAYYHDKKKPRYTEID